MVWEPKTCCGCCKPRIGALILGYLGVILSLLGVLGVIKTAFMSKEELEELCHTKRQYMDVSTCYRSSVTGMIISAVEEVIRGIICIMLIYGIKKRNQCLILPYMIMQVIGILLVGIAMLTFAILLAILNLWVGSIIILLIGPGIMFILTYCFLVVRVCYKEAAEQNLMKDSESVLGYMQHPELPPAYKM